MRIYHLDHGAGFGGAERSLLELALSQRELGHHPTVVSGRSGRLTAAAEANGLEVHVLDWPVGYVGIPQTGSTHTIAARIPDMFKAARVLRSDLRTGRPDVLHVHTRKAQLVAALAGGGAHTRILWHLRDDLPHRAIVQMAVRLAIRRADHAVALSRWMAEDYRRSRALPRSGRIGLVPSGVRVTSLSVLSTPWFDGQRQPVVGYIGQIARRKGPDLIVRAAEMLGDFSNASFLIIGDVAYPRAEAAYGEELRSSVTAASGTRLRWIPATGSPEEAFAAIDVLVVPNRLPEPFGRVIVEAMASHRPIVAVASGATTELLDATSAVLVPEATGAALAAGVRSVLADVEGARRRAAAAALKVGAYEPINVARRMDIEYAVLRG